LNTYIVATIKIWNIRNFHKIRKEINADWHLINDKKELILERVNAIKPRYIFFPHWSWRIPEEIYTNFECVIFHMTDLPFGRGGSPLQNLILRGINETKVSAIRVVKELDAGPVYLKRDLNLNGNAEEILIRCSDVTFSMIKYIIENQPSPIEQKGEPVVFKRRSPAESRLPDINDLAEIYNYIRMLDAEGYPKAFIDMNNLKLEFSKATMKRGHIVADVKIIPKSS